MSRMKLGAVALTLEAAAWAQLTVGGTGAVHLALYLLAHAGASAMVALLAWGLLPARYTHPRAAVVGLIFNFAFFIPVLGFVGVLAAIFGLPLLPRLGAPQRYRSVRLPELDPHERRQRAAFGQAGVRGFLANARAPVGLRVRALVALQNVPARVSSPLLRGLLGDPAEDLRLLAYGMLDGLEKRLAARIHEELQRHHNAPDARARGAAALRISQLYWELVYQGLVQGDLMRHALQQSLQFTRAALADTPEDAGLHLQLGRVLQMLGQSAEARQAYQETLGLGMPPTRVAPYLAEVAFDEGDYAEVQRMIALLEEWQVLPRLQPVIRFWSRGSGERAP